MSDEEAYLPSLNACLLLGFPGTFPRFFLLGFGFSLTGCDGGFRSPFVLYVSVWVTGLVFGTLLLFLEDRH